MKCGVYGLLTHLSKQHDDLSDQFIKCKTVKELKEAITPHVKMIVKKYEDRCYGTIDATVGSFRNEIYELEKAVDYISTFSIGTINMVVKDILEN